MEKRDIFNADDGKAKLGTLETQVQSCNHQKLKFSLPTFPLFLIKNYILAVL